MSLKLDKSPTFSGRQGPLLFIIMDGVGLAPAGPGNAVHVAKTPNLDRLLSSGLGVALDPGKQQQAAIEPTAQLLAHGPAVGLPTEQDMGNSEVGHNALGAGRIFEQGAKLVNKELDSGALFQSELWNEIEAQGKSGHTLHFIGLLSDGNVHSHINHLFAMLRRSAEQGVKRVRIHALLDGRDVLQRSALDYLKPTEDLMAELNAQYGCDYRIASGGGRMKVTMDRYESDWEMVKRGYDAHVHGIGRYFDSAIEAVEILYDENPGRGDQYLDSFVVVDEGGEPVGRIQDGDAVVLFNFRGDRAIEISRAFEERDFDKFDRGQALEVLYAGILQYDGDLQIPKRYLVEPPAIDRTLGEYLCTEQVSSFAISETQKYGHVTYFWNGNRSGYICEQLETYVEIPSDRIEFDQAPKMKAYEITDKTIELLRSGIKFGRLNFANGDMVGHTGVMEAAVEAVETVDECVGILLGEVKSLGGIAVVTADHGNADEMFTEKNGQRIVKTSHTLNPVPFVIVDPLYQGEYTMAKTAHPGLANVAATLLNLLGYQAPEDYESSLIEFV
ncbi:MAG: 2,3-bisphosphoglycerate-independent phosphoglycerate mutase [Gammaproteobacteria bacterium]|nr:2,3-bisphosphoglycerate-independent phosphoglycerate mutase [Gammaproteobacteria bacterium]